MFLSTKLLPRSDGETLVTSKSWQDPDERRNHVDEVDRFNASVNDVSASYQAAADKILRELAPSPGSSR